MSDLYFEFRADILEKEAERKLEEASALREAAAVWRELEANKSVTRDEAELEERPDLDLSNPVYSDIEDGDTALVLIESMIGGGEKILIQHVDPEEVDDLKDLGIPVEGV